MIDLLFIIIALCGFYMFSLHVLFRLFENSFKKESLFTNTERICLILFLSFLAWTLSSGLMGIMLVWGYFTNSPILISSLSSGLLGLVFILLTYQTLSCYKRINTLFFPLKLTGKEKVILGFILFMVLIYIYRVTIPWADNDEVEFYGYLSKLIAGGRTFKDILREGGFFGYVSSYLVQSKDSLLYGLVNDTYLMRFVRLINLLFCCLGIFSFLRFIKIGRFWSLMACAGLLSLPELGYLALSLKVDSVVMMFSLAAFLSILIAFSLYWKDKKYLWPAFCFSIVSLFLSALAFGNRFYEISSMFLCSCFVWFFLVKLTKKVAISFVGVFILFFLFIFLAAPGILFNFIIYNNPIYPIKPPIFFQKACYTLTSLQAKTDCNIIGLPPVIMQFYLIFALGIGIELAVKVLPFLHCFPMAALKTSSSLGWPYPLIFCVFFWPFFANRNKILNFIMAIFIFQLIFWSFTLHFSRLFIVSNIAAIIVAVIMADLPLPAHSRFLKYVQNTLRLWVILSLSLSLILQIWWLGKRYYGLFLVGNKKRYHAKIAFLKTKDYKEANELSLKDSELLNRILLKTEDKPVVYVFTYSREGVHILLDKRIHIMNFRYKDYRPRDNGYLLINPYFLKECKEVCKENLLRYFPKYVLTTPEAKWELYKTP